MKKKRLRVDRILYCLLFLVFIILFIKLGIIFTHNMIMFNSVKKNEIIKINKNEVKVWNKTVNYIHENMEYVTIKHKNNYFTINSKDFKNGLKLDVKIYNKKIDDALFDNVKSYYIENTDIIKKSTKVKIKLPRYLSKNECVDVYVKNNKKNEIYEKSIKVNNKYILFKTNKKYKSYFVTYIKLKNISVTPKVSVNVNGEKKLSVTLNPTNSTSKELIYEYDKKIISYEKGVIKGLKKGSTNLVIKSKKDNIKAIISVTVNEKTKSAIKTKEEVKEEKYETTIKDGITYVDGIMIVNKSYSLPKDYNPGGLTDEFMDAFYEMQAAAKLDNIDLFVASGFRSYDYQVDLYNKYVNEDGKDAADRYSARPGYSEHQTGLAADINAADSSFEDTPEAIWLDKNAHKYGFLIRFPKGKEEYTGYKYEPWHIRYVGVDIATKIYNSGDNISIEEYYGLESKYKD